MVAASEELQRHEAMKVIPSSPVNISAPLPPFVLANIGQNQTVSFKMTPSHQTLFENMSANSVAEVKILLERKRVTTLSFPFHSCIFLDLTKMEGHKSLCI